MQWVRIDNRLVHGQVIEAWIPHLRAAFLVVANDGLAADFFRQEIMGLAIPRGVRFVCCPLDETSAMLAELERTRKNQNSLLLFADCADARQVHMRGVTFSVLNVGNLHYGPGKEQICEHIALNDDDRGCLRYFQRQGIPFDYRCIPSETPYIEGCDTVLF